MKHSKCNWVRLGDYISQRREKNDSFDLPIYGVTRDGFIPPKQKEADTSKYNVFYLDDFVFNPARMEINSIYLNDFCPKAICSSLYEIFYINDTSILLPHFLLLFLKRDEFARQCEYIGWGSAREYCRVGDISEIMIPLPSPEEQQKVINAWKALREIKEQNEAIATPLMQVCQSYIQELKHKYESVEIGEYIEQNDIRNSEDILGEEVLRGVTSDGVFDFSKANTDGLKFNNYKIVSKGEFAYNPSRINLGSIALCSMDKCIVSPMYVVFRLNEKGVENIIPEYLNLWYRRAEFQRSTLFFASGSVRDTFDFNSMKDICIPLPPLEVQQAVVNIYNCANEAKRIAEEADRKSREVCPALIQHVIHQSEKA